MEFSDFIGKEQELIGKTVLYESGFTYGGKKYSLHKIVSVGKTGFRIFAMPDAIFSLINGERKGLNSKMDMSTVSNCTLITEEQANEYRQQWKLKKEERILREEMKIKFDSLTIEQLKRFKTII